jgi:hypothetical protein
MHENRGVVVRIQKLTEERRSKGAYWCWILCKINYKIATVSRLYALPLSHDFRINLVNSTFLLACLPCSWVRSVSTNHMITTIKFCLPRLLGFLSVHVRMLFQLTLSRVIHIELGSFRVLRL